MRSWPLFFLVVFVLLQTVSLLLAQIRHDLNQTWLKTVMTYESLLKRFGRSSPVINLHFRTKEQIQIWTMQRKGCQNQNYKLKSSLIYQWNIVKIIMFKVINMDHKMSHKCLTMINIFYISSRMEKAGLSFPVYAKRSGKYTAISVPLTLKRMV